MPELRTESIDELGARVMLGPLPGAQRLQLRRLIAQLPGVLIVGQAFSLEQVPALAEAQRARWLLLAGLKDLQALSPLPARLRGCILLEGMVPSAIPTLSSPLPPAPPGLRLVRVSCPAELEQVGTGHAFLQDLGRAFGLTPDVAWAQGRAAAIGDAHALAAGPVADPSVGACAAGFRVLAIGASTGGPDALAALLSPLAGRLHVPVVVTQHIGAGFSAALAGSLAQRCRMPVHEAADGQGLQAGQVYLAPAQRHLRVQARDGQLMACLDDGPPECFCKPSVDVMLRSLAEAPGLKTLVVILTGMGQDGLEGARRVHARGGCILAQDEASSVVWGMPGAVAGAGLCEAVLPPAALAQRVLRRLGEGGLPP